MNKDNDKRIYTLSQEKPAKAVLKMSVPLVFGMFIMVLYNMVDTYFIGLTGDDYQMAAVNLAYPVMMVTVAISNMIGTGASSFIARCLGSDDREKASHTLTSAFTLTFINSVIIIYAYIYQQRYHYGDRACISFSYRQITRSKRQYISIYTAICSGDPDGQLSDYGKLHNQCAAEK